MPLTARPNERSLVDEMADPPQPTRLWKWRPTTVLSTARRILDAFRGESGAAQGERRRARMDAIRASGLFDHEYYAHQAGLSIGPEACLRHYVDHGALAGHAPNLLFDPAAYARLHPEIQSSGVEPFDHYLTCGIDEGRTTSLTSDGRKLIETADPAALEERRISAQLIRSGWDREGVSPWANHVVGVYASSLGNFFFRQIADQIATALRADGVLVQRLDQNSERPCAMAADIFVAPHEFFLLGGGRAWLGRREVEHAVMVNTEQPGTHWHSLALRMAGPEVTMVDLSPHSALLIRDMHWRRSGYLPLGWIDGVTDGENAPSGRPAEEDAFAISEASGADVVGDPNDRDLDVVFMGTLTERRSRALAKLAPTLSRYRCHIHAPTAFGRPLTGSRGIFGMGESIAVARRTRIMLNIHRSDTPYFEWHRIVTLGIRQRALVLSERCLAVPGVDAGRHYLEAGLEEMAARIDEILTTRQGAEQAAAIRNRSAAELPRRFDLRLELSALAALHGS